jgi:PTS system mannose-specific IID component
MTITPAQALLIGLVYFAANTSFLGGLGYFTTWRPLVNGLLVGIILGNPVLGITIGALINVLYLGYMSVGGTLGIGDAALAGILGATAGVATPLAASQPVEATGLGVLSGVLLGNLGFPLLSLRLSLDNRLVHRMDCAAVEGNTGAIMRLNVLAGQALLLALTVPAAAILAWVAPALINLSISFLPAWIMRGVGVAGTGMAGALGIALAMRFVFKARGVPLFFAGFALVVLLSILLLHINIAWFVMAALLLAGLRIVRPLVLIAASFRKPPTGHTFGLWQFFSHSTYSFERLQGSGVACALAPAIERLYAHTEDRAAALQRHMAFFNVEPNWGQVILGITQRMEEQHAAGQLSAETIPATKQSLMGTVSGFGDSVSQGAILPLILSLALAISLDHSHPILPALGVTLYLLMIGPLMLAISYYAFHIGYTRGPEGVIAILGNRPLRQWITLAERLGAFMLGVLAATPAVTGLQLNLFDGLAEQFVNIVSPLVLILLFYWILQKFQVKPILLLPVIIVAGLLLALAGLS